MKGEKRTAEKELNKMETSTLLDAEFTTLVVRTLRDAREEQAHSGRSSTAQKWTWKHNEEPVRSEGYTKRNEDNLQGIKLWSG